MPTRHLTPEIISAAITGFEAQKKEIDGQIAELRAMLPGGTTESAPTAETSPKHKRFSAAARRRMKEAQQRRWAKIRGESAQPSVTREPRKPKRKLSAAGRRAISEATKRRWALKRAESGRKQPAADKKSVAKKPAAKKPRKEAAKAAEQIA